VALQPALLDLAPSAVPITKPPFGTGPAVAPPQPALDFREGKPSLRLRANSQILTRTTGRLGIFDYSLNPYVGCGFGCSYCYASFFQPDPERFETWGKWVDAKTGAVETILRTRNLKGKRIYMSSATDPYQPVEARLGLTRRILEALSNPERQPRLVVQTRGPLVTRDIDLLTRFEHVRVNVSITTDSEDVRMAFEPACASIQRRLEAVARLHDAGIKTAVCIAPMLPIEDPAAFARRIKQTGSDHVGFGWFHFSDRPFAASTRPEAVRMLDAWGWNEDSYRRTQTELKSRLARLESSGEAWLPV
jgi:DNA repair photolyase